MRDFRNWSYHIKFPVFVQESRDTKRRNTTSNKWKIGINNSSLLIHSRWYQCTIETWPVHPQEDSSCKTNKKLPFSGMLKSHSFDERTVLTWLFIDIVLWIKKKKLKELFPLYLNNFHPENYPLLPLSRSPFLVFSLYLRSNLPIIAKRSEWYTDPSFGLLSVSEGLCSTNAKAKPK